MALWSSTDANTGAPKFAAASGLGVSANGRVLYANTQASAFVTGANVGTPANVILIELTRCKL